MTLYGRGEKVLYEYFFVLLALFHVLYGHLVRGPLARLLPWARSTRYHKIYKFFNSHFFFIWAKGQKNDDGKRALLGPSCPAKIYKYIYTGTEKSNRTTTATQISKPCLCKKENTCTPPRVIHTRQCSQQCVLALVNHTWWRRVSPRYNTA